MFTSALGERKFGGFEVANIQCFFRGHWLITVESAGDTLRNALRAITCVCISYLWSFTLNRSSFLSSQS